MADVFTFTSENLNLKSFSILDGFEVSGRPVRINPCYVGEWLAPSNTELSLSNGMAGISLGWPDKTQRAGLGAVEMLKSRSRTFITMNWNSQQNKQS